MRSLQGRFLVATPQQLDPAFVQAVVLMIRHNPRGAFGLIVNCPCHESSRAVWPRATRSRYHARPQLYCGGPVKGHPVALHTDESLAEIEVLPKLFFTGKRRHILALCEQTAHPYKIFVGYAGWGPRQVDDDVAQGAWRVAPARAEHVLSCRDDLWHAVSKPLVESVLRSMCHLAYIPDDPLLN